MILKHIIQCTIDAHRATGIVNGRLGHCAARGLVHFVDSAPVRSTAPIGFNFLDEIPVAVVDELGGLPAHSHRDEAVASTGSAQVSASKASH